MTLIKKLIIYAPNVGGGGGLVLLRELLRASWPAMKVIAVLDRRGRAHIGDIGESIDVHWVHSTMGGRWHAERLLPRLADIGGLTLCFHNLPPVFPVRGHVYCYVQNANLVGLIPASDLSGWVRLRSAAERFIARRFRHRIHRYLVQTETMAKALREWHGPGVPPVDVLPFVADDAIAKVPAATVIADATGRQWDFLYVSDGSIHKNHRQLFAAWQLLADEGLRPSLALTLHPERDGELRRYVDALALAGLRIEDLGQMSHIDVLATYGRSRALIFPSYAESFGIPLIEARSQGLPILAPELDYVRDVCEPAVTFDATSPRSIARAVRRFLGQSEGITTPLTPDRFAATLCALDPQGDD